MSVLGPGTQKNAKFQDGTIIQTGITLKQLLYKNLLSSVRLWSRVQFSINKKENWFSLLDYQSTENSVLIFELYENRTKKNLYLHS